METIASLVSRQARTGRLDWIGIRPRRRDEVVEVERAQLSETGLKGDHYVSGGKRSLTLIQHEHLAAIASLMNLPNVHPSSLRRNLVVSGINLIGLKNREFCIGSVLVRGTGICAPCSRMEESLGYGGYSAMRGHGGITAQILNPGTITIGDAISLH